jgi:hypothetical protein
MGSTMTNEGQGFLGRWSRLKREAAAAPESEPVAVPEPAPEPFDSTTLPPLDSLDAASDYAAFLQPGVPWELRTLALRRAWATDPAITGYKALADYDWDFNAPGYGALRLTDDVVQLVGRVLGSDEVSAPDQGDTAPPPPEPAPQISAEVPPVRPEAAVPAPDPMPAPAFRRRRHGGAVPA